MHTCFKSFAATVALNITGTSYVITSFGNSPRFCALTIVELHNTDKGFKNIPSY